MCRAFPKECLLAIYTLIFSFLAGRTVQWYKQCPEEFHNTMEIVCTATCYWKIASRAIFEISETPEKLTVPVTIWVVLYKHLLIGQQIVAQFMDGSSRVNGQHSAWETTTLTEQSKNESRTVG